MSSLAEPVPSWAILVPTIPRRAESFHRLMDRLLPQVQAINNARSAENDWAPVAIIAWLNEGHRLGLGAIRDEMLRYADLAGFEYVSFIDDEGIRLAKARGTWLGFDIYNTEYTLAEGEKNGVLPENIAKERAVGTLQRENFAKAARAMRRCATVTTII